MHEFWRSWRGRVLWLGALALLLQQVPVSYLIALPGSDTPPAAASIPASCWRSRCSTATAGCCSAAA
jgi:hypothetical protein